MHTENNKGSMHSPFQTAAGSSSLAWEHTPLLLSFSDAEVEGKKYNCALANQLNLSTVCNPLVSVPWHGLSVSV